MPHKDPEVAATYRWFHKRTPGQRKIQAAYRKKNRRTIAAGIRRYNFKAKIEALTYYGDGKLQCKWLGCDITDVDMLTLDHINDDGGVDGRDREMSGNKLYKFLRANNYPEGLQTLCANHQAKKEALRQRRASDTYHLFMDAIERGEL